MTLCALNRIFSAKKYKQITHNKRKHNNNTVLQCYASKICSMYCIYNSVWNEYGEGIFVYERICLSTSM